PDAHRHSNSATPRRHTFASHSAANLAHRCSSRRSTAAPSSPDDRQLALDHPSLHTRCRTPTDPGSAPGPPQIAPNDPREANRAVTAASLSADRSDHQQSISSCLVLCQMLGVALGPPYLHYIQPI